jgi:hypothetical protein
MKDKTKVQLLIILQIFGVALGTYLIRTDAMEFGIPIVIINLVGFYFNIKTLKLINK